MPDPKLSPGSIAADKMTMDELVLEVHRLRASLADVEKERDALYAALPNCVHTDCWGRKIKATRQQFGEYKCDEHASQTDMNWAALVRARKAPTP